MLLAAEHQKRFEHSFCFSLLRQQFRHYVLWIVYYMILSSILFSSGIKSKYISIINTKYVYKKYSLMFQDFSKLPRLKRVFAQTFSLMWQPHWISTEDEVNSMLSISSKRTKILFLIANQPITLLVWSHQQYGHPHPAGKRY